MLIMASICHGEPGDVTITFTIPAKDVPVFRERFLAICPVPMVANPAYTTDPNEVADPPEPERINKYTDKQWFKVRIKKWLFVILRKGRIKIATESSVPMDPNAIQ